MLTSGRRDFLKGTAWMGAVASLSGCAASKAMSSVCEPGMMTCPSCRCQRPMTCAALLPQLSAMERTSGFVR